MLASDAYWRLWPLIPAAFLLAGFISGRAGWLWWFVIPAFFWFRGGHRRYSHHHRGTRY